MGKLCGFKYYITRSTHPISLSILKKFGSKEINSYVVEENV